jgi:hypothetical protein
MPLFIRSGVLAVLGIIVSAVHRYGDAAAADAGVKKSLEAFENGFSSRMTDANVLAILSAKDAVFYCLFAAFILFGLYTAFAWYKEIKRFIRSRQ